VYCTAVQIERSAALGQWIKSSFSGVGDCVEIRRGEATVAVRDSKIPAGPVLEFTDAEWRAFVLGVKDGQFD